MPRRVLTPCQLAFPGPSQVQNGVGENHRVPALLRGMSERDHRSRAPVPVTTRCRQKGEARWRISTRPRCITTTSRCRRSSQGRLGSGTRGARSWRPPAWRRCGTLLAACGGDNKSSSPTTASGGATTTAASSGATTAAAGATTTGAATGASTTAGARTEAKTETITVGVPSLQEAFVDPHWAVGGLIFPLMWAIADFLYMQDSERQVRADPGDRVRPQRRQADLDVQAAPRRDDARRDALHGQPT